LKDGPASPILDRRTRRADRFGARSEWPCPRRRLRPLPRAAFLAAAGVAAWFDARFWHEAPLRGARGARRRDRRGDGMRGPRLGGAYAIDRLGAPRAHRTNAEGGHPRRAAAIACLFLVNADTPPCGRFPSLLARARSCWKRFRLFLRALIHRWRKAGRFRRRIAVVAASDFAREFIERLRIRRYRRHGRLRRGGRPASRRSSRLTGSQPLQPLRRRRRCLDYAELALIRSVEVEDEIVNALARGNMGTQLSCAMERRRRREMSRSPCGSWRIERSADPAARLLDRGGPSVLRPIIAPAASPRRGQEVAQVFYASLLKRGRAFAISYLGEWRLCTPAPARRWLLAKETPTARPAVFASSRSPGCTHRRSITRRKRRAEAALNPRRTKSVQLFFGPHLCSPKRALACATMRAACAFPTDRRQDRDRGDRHGSVHLSRAFFSIGPNISSRLAIWRARGAGARASPHRRTAPERTYLALSHDCSPRIARREGDVEGARQR